MNKLARVNIWKGKDSLTIPSLNAVLQNITTTWNQTDAGNLTWSNMNSTASSIGTLTVTGAATVGTTLAVTGAVTLSSTLGVTGASTFTSGTFSTTLGVTGTSTLGVVNASGTATFSGQLIGKGTTTNDNAAAGNIGEYMESVVAAVNAFGAATWGDITSLSLTAGDWNVNLQLMCSRNTATIAGIDFRCGISSTSGNSTTGLTTGSNQMYFINTVSNGMDWVPFCIADFRVSLASTTTYFAKGYAANYSVATPQFYARFSARRVR